MRCGRGARRSSCGYLPGPVLMTTASGPDARLGSGSEQFVRLLPTTRAPRHDLLANLVPCKMPAGSNPAGCSSPGVVGAFSGLHCCTAILGCMDVDVTRSIRSSPREALLFQKLDPGAHAAHNLDNAQVPCSRRSAAVAARQHVLDL